MIAATTIGCAGRATFHVPDIDGCASVLPPTGTKELLAAQRTAVARGGPKWKRMVSDLCAEARPTAPTKTHSDADSFWRY